jgi:hypothetical protein
MRSFLHVPPLAVAVTPIATAWAGAPTGSVGHGGNMSIDTAQGDLPAGLPGIRPQPRVATVRGQRGDVQRGFSPTSHTFADASAAPVARLDKARRSGAQRIGHAAAP